MGFARAVRDAFDSHFPDYKFFKSTPGPGTFVIFERQRAGFREEIRVQKSSWSDWFRLNVGVNGSSEIFGPDIGGADDAQVAAWLRKNAAPLRKRFDAYFDKVEAQYAKEARAIEKLPSLYVAWYRSVGQALPTAEFLVDAKFREKARASFAKHAGMRNNESLDAFWNGERPRRADEDDGRLFTCAVCRTQKPRARMVFRPTSMTQLRKWKLLDARCKSCARRKANTRV